MKRGKIIQYNGDAGTGIVSADGEKHAFGIAQWSGDDAPTVNRLVEIDFSEAGVGNVSPIPESVLMQEKAGELQKALEIKGKQFSSKAISIFGLPIIIGYAVFVIASFFLPYGKVSFFGAGVSMTFSQVTQAMDLTGGVFHLIFLAAVFSPALLFFTQERKAWMVLCLPLLAVLASMYGAWGQYRDATEQFRSISSSMGSLGGFATAAAEKMSFSNVFTVGAGFYVLLAVSLFIAWKSISRYLAHG